MSEVIGFLDSSASQLVWIVPKIYQLQILIYHGVEKSGGSKSGERQRNWTAVLGR